MVGRLLLASCGKKVGLEFMWDVTDQKLRCCGDTLISRDLLVYIYICAKHQMDRSQVLMARHGYLGQQLLGSEKTGTHPMVYPWKYHHFLFQLKPTLENPPIFRYISDIFLESLEIVF